AALPRGGRSRAEGGAVPGDDHACGGEDPLPAGPQHRARGGQRVLGRAVRPPPGVGARVDAVGRGRQGGDVLGRVPGSGHQPDRGGELEVTGLAADPQVAFVGGPVVVDAGTEEQRRVDRVVGVVVAEHDVGDVAGGRPVRGERGNQRVPVGHHARVDHDHPAAVQDQRDGGAHPVTGGIVAYVALVQDVHGGRAGDRCV